jgi:hypothetical protein
MPFRTSMAGRPRAANSKVNNDVGLNGSCDRLRRRKELRAERACRCCAAESGDSSSMTGTLHWRHCIRYLTDFADRSIPQWNSYQSDEGFQNEGFQNV